MIEMDLQVLLVKFPEIYKTQMKTINMRNTKLWSDRNGSASVFSKVSREQQNSYENDKRV